MFIAAAESASPVAAGLAPAGTNLSLSVTAPIRRAEWQQRLTLGPGDTLNLVLFDMPDTAHIEGTHWAGWAHQFFAGARDHGRRADD